MNRPIRVLELRSVRGTGGGPEKTIMFGAQAASPSEFDITVCYIRDDRDEVYSLDERARRMNINYIEVPERHSFDPRIWPKLRAVVQSRGIDVVHSHEHKTDLLALLLARADAIVPLATAHGWVGQSWREKLYYRADKYLLTRFPAVIAVSSEIRQELIRWGAVPDAVITILNAIDPAVYARDDSRVAEVRSALGFADTDLVVAGVGRLERQKRFDILLRAFAELRARRSDPALKLVIAGAGSLFDSLRAEASELGLDSSCRFLGNHGDIIGLHHAVDLFVQSSEYEGTPNAVLEAMAMSTPIVATDVGGTAELLCDGAHGLIVAPGDATALASAMEQALFGDPAAARARARTARRRVEQELSFSARCAAVESVYRRLVHLRQSGTNAS